VERRAWTTTAACLLALALGVLGGTLPVPMVALGAGPTYDTLGTVESDQVVTIEGPTSYPTSGQLNMTTVSVTDRLTMFSALGLWASPEYRVVPRELIYPSAKSLDEIQEQNSAQFSSSEANAESAALGELQIPTTVVVSALVAGTPAASILAPGDELLDVANQPMNSVRAVSDALMATRPGDTVTVRYRREGAVHERDIPLAAHPDGRQGLLGVVLSGKLRDGDIRISLAGIGGPSAGLMFSLALVDKLTPGELTGGRFVAGTGAITPNGIVTKIDGIPFKMRAARDAGATVFLVPADNCEEAASTAPDGLQLVRVDTLHTAVVALDDLNAGRAPVGCAAP
jgi:PDZ domain-containing protein